MRSWANSERASDELLTAVHNGLPVRLIATNRNDLCTCRRDELLSEVIERNNEGYDHWPVVNEANQIVGLLDLAPSEGATNAADLVGDHCQPLDESNLMGADASILSFIRHAHRQSCRLLLSGPEISGMVTASDLHKLPVRVAIFCLVTNLEMTMADAIAREGLPAEEWLTRLSDMRKEKLTNEIADAKKRDAYVNDLLFTQFCDKITIIQKSSRFTGGKNKFGSEMSQVMKLRDKIAHANEFAPDAIAVTELSQTVELMDAWAQFLTAWPET